MYAVLHATMHLAVLAFSYCVMITLLPVDFGCVFACMKLQLLSCSRVHLQIIILAQHGLH